MGRAIQIPKRKAGRSYKKADEIELWARAAGRCEMPMCNKILYRDERTSTSARLGEKAHVYPFSASGPRGRSRSSLEPEKLNGPGNLMLLCPSCHAAIDVPMQEAKYTPQFLLDAKRKHEERIELVTSINPDRKTQILTYGASIGDQNRQISHDAARTAVFPDYFPAEYAPTEIGMSWAGRDSEPNYYSTEQENLLKRFKQVEEGLFRNPEKSHISVFGFAPMPLLIQFGALLTDKSNVRVFQLHRNPQQSWQWKSDVEPVRFEIIKPESTQFPPALIVSLSAHIDPGRVYGVLGRDVSLWILRADRADQELIRSEGQLNEFRRVIRELMNTISTTHRGQVLSIFPAMPVSCAVTTGLVRSPKADIPWAIYDHNNVQGAFVRALNIE